MAKLFVANLPFSATESEMEDLFAQHGEIISVNIISDRTTGRALGYGFIEMDDAAAEAAIAALNGTDFGGRDLRVEIARERTERSDRRPRREW
jgi:RNA recognition motif-containing protein